MMAFRHKKTGGIYRIMSLAAQESTLEPLVVYVNASGMVWVRPADEFFDGRFEVVIENPEMAAFSRTGQTQH